MSIVNLISLPSGLALFLYGISLMGDGLNLVAHDVFDTHEYLDSLKDIKDAAFAASYEDFRSKYVLYRKRFSQTSSSPLPGSPAPIFILLHFFLSPHPKRAGRIRSFFFCRSAPRLYFRARPLS